MIVEVEIPASLQINGILPTFLKLANGRIVLRHHKSDQQHYGADRANENACRSWPGPNAA